MVGHNTVQTVMYCDHLRNNPTVNGVLKVGAMPEPFRAVVRTMALAL